MSTTPPEGPPPPRPGISVRELIAVAFAVAGLAVLVAAAFATDLVLGVAAAGAALFVLGVLLGVGG